jgi:mannose-6-phosphate isomerase-like protein (cupin superfamily)
VAATQRHYHALSEEIYLIVEGGGALDIDGERGDVGRGLGNCVGVRLESDPNTISSARGTS